MTGLRYLAYFAPFLLLCVLYPGSLAQLIDVQAFIGFSAPVFLIRMALINQILPLRQLRSESPYAAYFYHRTMARACTIAPLFPVIYCYTYAFFQQSPPEQLGPIIAYTVLGTMYCILYYTWHLSLECRALNANDDTQRFLTGHQRFSLLLATAMFLALVGAIAVVLFSALELDDAQGVLSYVMDQFDLVTTVSYLPVSALVTWLVFTLFCAWSYVKLGYRLCSGTACFLKACAVTAPLAAALISCIDVIWFLGAMEETEGLVANFSARIALIPLAAIVAAAISLYQRVARQQSEVPALEQPEYHGKRWQSALFFLFCLGVFGFSLVSLGLERSSLFATAIFGAAPFWFIRKRVRLEHTIEARTAALQVAERALIEEQKQRIEFVRGAFGKYVSRAVVDEIMANPEMVGQLGGEQRYMSAFFSDVTSFSAISERLTPTELVQLVNEYLGEMCEILERHGATIDKFEGDAIRAFFGAPVAFDDHAQRAVRAGIEQQQKLVELRDRWRVDPNMPAALRQLQTQWEEEGRTFWQVRMGMTCGDIVVGNRGSKNRTDYTMMSDTVNLAARFESGQKFYGTSIMINDSMYEIVSGEVETRKIDLIQVMGREGAVTAYEVLGLKGELSPLTRRVLEVYARGMEAYERFDFEGALDLFRQALDIDPGDGPSALYVDRCEEYVVAPPTDLIHRAQEK